MHQGCILEWARKQIYWVYMRSLYLLWHGWSRMNTPPISESTADTVIVGIISATWNQKVQCPWWTFSVLLGFTMNLVIIDPFMWMQLRVFACGLKSVFLKYIFSKFNMTILWVCQVSSYRLLRYISSFGQLYYLSRWVTAIVYCLNRNYNLNYLTLYLNSLIW